MPRPDLSVAFGPNLGLDTYGASLLYKHVLSMLSQTDCAIDIRSARTFVMTITVFSST